MTQTVGWCTNWEAYDLPRLWQMVSDEDDEAGWAQVQAWFRMRNAIDAYRKRLEACRQALQDGWPPEQSPASAAFIERIEALIASMAATAASAERTAHGLAGIMKALATAKAEMEPLYRKWQDVSSDLTPRWLDGAEDELNAKARAIMRTADLAVTDYTQMIEIPAVYTYRARDFGEFAPVDKVRTNELVLDENTPSSTAGSWDIPMPHNPPSALPGIEPVLPGAGPILSDGTATPPAMIPNSPTPSTPNVPGIGGTGGHGTIKAPIPNPLPNLRGGIPAQHPVSPRMTSGGTTVMPTVPPAAARGAHSIGIPGRRPATPPGLPLMAPPMTSPATTVGSGSRPAGSAYRTATGHLATMSGGNQRDGRRRPDDPWTVEVGVAPVITPPQPRPYDPGPGIIGIDR